MIFLNNKIALAPSFCIGVCITLFILPFPWIFAWCAGCLLHELGHYIALKLLHVPVERITLSFRGAYMETGCMQPHVEILTALAGPLAGLCCLFASSYFPPLAVCGFVQSTYNLLPFPNFDGGRALKVLLRYCFSEKLSDAVYRCVVTSIYAGLIILGVYLWLIVKLGPLFLLLFMIPILKNGFVKIPCKGAKEIVQ